MAIFIKTLPLETKKQFEIVDITPMVESILEKSHIQNGLCTVFCPHTTASVKINQNEPLLLQDIMKNIYHLVPTDTNYSHDLFEIRKGVAPNERSNGHAHIKSLLFGHSENIIIQDSQFLLGNKQSILFVEFDGGKSRKVVIQIMGE